MSRLESQAKAGFYPTPPRVVAAIAAHLTPMQASGKQTVRLLDPCAGEGEAVAALADALGAESFGIELNSARAASVRARLDHALTGSAFSVRSTNGAFSCLFLNPPYDSDEEHTRLEHAFLVGLSRALCPGGLLILIIPQGRLAMSARYLAAHYGDHFAFRFPDPDYASFGQIVLFAMKKVRPSVDTMAQERLITWSEIALPSLPDRPQDDSTRFRVPALPAGEPIFASLFFDPAQAADEARQRGVWASPQLTEQLWPADEAPVRPLMPLRRGHLALLIAAGVLNNVVLTRGDERVLVKGRTVKATIADEDDDETTLVEREVLRTMVTLLDLRDGALTVVADGGAEAPSALPTSPAHSARQAA